MARTLSFSRLQILAAAALFSTGGAAIKATSLSSWQVASFRSGIAVLSLLIMLPAGRRGWSLRALAVGSSYAGALVFYALANKLTTAANTIFLQSTAPLYILFLAPWLLGERLRRRDLLFMACVAAGLVLLLVGVEPGSRTAPDPLTGNLLATAAGVSWALTVIGLRWLGREGGESGGASAAMLSGNLIAFLVCLPAALPLRAAAPADWLIVVYLGVFQIGLAYVFLTSGLRRVEALETSLLLLIEPVLNPIWAWWLHGERPGPWSLAGGAVILAATAAKTLYEFLAARRRGLRLRGDPPPARSSGGRGAAPDRP